MPVQFGLKSSMEMMFGFRVPVCAGFGLVWFGFLSFHIKSHSLDQFYFSFFLYMLYLNPEGFIFTKELLMLALE